jgi:hypothetical protein
MSWDRSYTSSYRLMRVDRETGYEVSAIPNVVNGGSINRNIDTATYESGKLSVVGTVDVGRDLVRLYHDAVLRDGSTMTEAIGTFLPNVPSKDIHGATSESELELDGRLTELAEDEFERPVTIPAGSYAVEEARAIAIGAGLEVVADESDWQLSSDWVVGMGGGADEPTDKLGVINKLLGLAGFSSARTDPFGRVLMQRYRDPSSASPEYVFSEGPDARFLTEATEERDKSGVCNVVIVVYSTQDEETRGVAYDDDPRSPYSTVSTGRRKVKRYEYQDGATQAQADAKAEELLKTQQSVIHRVNLQHVFRPDVTCGTVVGCEWPSQGISGSFAVRTQSLALGAGCLTKSELRRFERGF